ncbi:T3SS effector NleG family protein [Escherichia coli]|nr:T3SS effector NleG family protein [Escherichia coli]
MPLTSDIRSHSFNLGVEVVRARIVANGRGDITVGGETVSIVYDSTNGRTLEQPEKGIFVKNSDGSDVCTLFDAAAFSRLVGEGLPHPLTREPITASIIVKHEECIYDDTRGNFVIKGN